jgi:hypothetical protein
MLKILIVSVNLRFNVRLKHGPEDSILKETNSGIECLKNSYS